MDGQSRNRGILLVRMLKNFRSAMLFLSIGLPSLTGQICYAESDDTSAEMQINEAIVLFEGGRFDTALALFESLADDNAVAAKYVELCQYQIGSGRLTPYDNHAVDGYDNASVDCGDTVGCGSTCQAEAKPWHLTFLTGHQYDSNVTLEPQFTGLGSGRGIEDSSWFEAFFGDYQIVQQSNWNVGLIGSAYSNHYFSANQFDAQDYMGGVYTNFLLSRHVMAGVRYEFHETLLDYSQFATQHRLVPNVTILEGDLGHITFYYEFEGQEFDAAPLIGAMDRSGDTNSVGVTQAIYTWDGQGRIFFGYRYERSATDGTDFDRKTHMATVRAERPLGCRMVLDGEVRYFWDNYDNSNSLDFVGRARKDRRTEVRAGLQYIVNEHVSLRGDYTFIDSDSNTANLFGVRFFNYDRHLFSTQFIYDF